MASVNGISQAGTAIAANQLKNRVDIAVLQKQQETAKQTGDAMVQLIQAAVDVGDRLDIRG